MKELQDYINELHQTGQLSGYSHSKLSHLIGQAVGNYADEFYLIVEKRLRKLVREEISSFALEELAKSMMNNESD